MVGVSPSLARWLRPLKKTVQGKAIVDATSIATVDFSAAGLTGALATYIAAAGNGIHGNLTGIKTKDADVNIIITPTIENITAAQVIQLNNIAAATTID